MVLTGQASQAMCLTPGPWRGHRPRGSTAGAGLRGRVWKKLRTELLALLLVARSYERNKGHRHERNEKLPKVQFVDTLRKDFKEPSSDVLLICRKMRTSCRLLRLNSYPSKETSFSKMSISAESESASALDGSARASIGRLDPALAQAARGACLQ